MTHTNTFFVIGLSYKTAAIDVRSKFSLSDLQLHALMLEAKQIGLNEMLVITTCNRTELYGWAESEEYLIQLLCNHSKGDRALFDQIGFCYQGTAAFHHIFRVGTGLESQILGDFEVIGQLKQSFYRSKRLGMINGRSERLVNAVIQSSKRIKTETKISTGATSVAFASVQYILKNVTDISTKKILLFGTGKIGRNTCENLVKHTKNEHIVLINRTEEKAREVASKFPVKVKAFGELATEIRKADVLIVATAGQHPTVNSDLIYNTKPLLILDLSLPKNVDPKVGEMDFINLVHLDELSQITDATLEKRKQYIPQAERIIEEIKYEFLEWLSQRKYAPTLKAFKEKISLSPLESEKQEEAVVQKTSQLAQKLTGQIAHYLKENPQKADETIAVLHDVFQLEKLVNNE